jgi:nitrous oxide reductase accessory protein NosL
MLISTAAGNAEIVSTTSDTRFYDDVGCLAADWKIHNTDAHAFVRVSSGAWVDAATASYGRPAGARTAMGSGFVAFASAADARAALGAGAIMTFDDLVQQQGAAR